MTKMEAIGYLEKMQARCRKTDGKIDFFEDIERALKADALDIAIHLLKYPQDDVCRTCIYYKPEHVLLNDGTERAYTDADINELGIRMVSVDAGTNIGGQCFYDVLHGPAENAGFRSENDYCSKWKYGENIPLNAEN